MSWADDLDHGSLARDRGKGGLRRAKKSFRSAYWLARFGLPAEDPRHATSIADIPFLARRSGSNVRSASARSLWTEASKDLEMIHIQPRARGSLFHLRMEVKHWQTYQESMKERIGRFIQESDEVLEALSQESSSPHRLVSRWRGEKPAAFDDTRKLMTACLLIASASDDNRPSDQSQNTQNTPLKSRWIEFGAGRLRMFSSSHGTREPKEVVGCG